MHSGRSQEEGHPQALSRQADACAPVAAEPAGPRSRVMAERAVYATAALFPLGLGLLCALGEFQYLDVYRWRYAGAMVLVAAFLIYVAGRESDDEAATKLGFFTKALFCALVAMSIRSLVLAFLNAGLSTDYAKVHENAKDFMHSEAGNVYAARYPYWGFMAVIMSLVYRVFGSTRLVYENFNVVCSGITTMALCYAGRGLTRSRAAGLAAGLVFACWPSLILYSNLLTPEHLFAMLLPFVCLTFRHAMTSLPPREKLRWFAATGCLVGLMECFKPIASALLFALALTMVIHADPEQAPAFFARPGLLARIASTPRRRLLPWTGVLVLVLAGGFEATRELGLAAVEYNAGYAVNRHGLGETLRVGLDWRGRGRYARSVRERLEEVQEQYGADFRATDAVLMRDVRVMLSEHYTELPRLFLDKFYYFWSSEDQMYYWATHAPRHNGLIAYDARALDFFVRPWIDTYGALMLLLACCGAVLCALRRPGPAMLSVALLLVGMACILLITEVQQRYRSVTGSAVALLAGYGVVAVHGWLSWARTKVGSARSLAKILRWSAPRRTGQVARSAGEPT
jgi:hypothetical protein